MPIVSEVAEEPLIMTWTKALAAKLVEAPPIILVPPAIIIIIIIIIIPAIIIIIIIVVVAYSQLRLE